MKSNQKNLLILSGLIILCLVLIWWVIKPAVASIRESDEEIYNQKEKLAQLLQGGQSVVENQKNLKMVEAEINRIKIVWLGIGDELKFITDLEEAAENNNLKQTINFNNNDYNDKVSVKMIPITLYVEGELENIMNYINDLESFDYYININKVEIKSQAKDRGRSLAKQVDKETEEEATKLSVKIDGITYWK